MNRRDQSAFIRLALRNGARVVNGAKHVKVYAADGRYLVSLHHGSHGDTHAGDGALRVARREGWS